ncbi:hypothetical protein WDU94_001056 [Cyamophila willieti]
MNVVRYSQQPTTTTEEKQRSPSQQGTDVTISENLEESAVTKGTNVCEAQEPSDPEYTSPETEILDRTERFSCGDRLPYEESMDKSESSIVNFFSASMETIKSRFTGHSDDFSDFVENMESELAEAIIQVTNQQDETSDQVTNKQAEIQDKPGLERKSSTKSLEYQNKHEEIEYKSKQIAEVKVDKAVEQTPQYGEHLEYTETCHTESKLKENAVQKSPPLKEALPKDLKPKRYESICKDSLDESSQSADVTKESDRNAEVSKDTVWDADVTEEAAVDQTADVSQKLIENVPSDEDSRNKANVNQESTQDLVKIEDVLKESVEEVKVTKDSTEGVDVIKASIQENAEIINGSVTQASVDVINESIQENLSPKSSASEILSDSTIDNQLNECRNCQHTKVDSLDFLSDEELKCASELTKEEGNLLDQLKKLEAEKFRVDKVVSRNESRESSLPGGSNLELVVQICQEEVTLDDDKSDDKSPDLVVTQETSSTRDEVGTFTTAPQETSTPKTQKKKKKKKHHTSKEDLNQTTEPNKIKKSESESEVSTSADLVQVDTAVSGKHTSDLKTTETKVLPKTEEIIPVLKESDQLNIDSQEDSASDTKSKSKKKKKKKLNKGNKEEPTTTNQNVQQEVGPQTEKEIEMEKEVDKLKTEPEDIAVIEESEKVIEEQNAEIATELKKADDSKPTKKKKSKLTRHMTRAILDAMKGEAVFEEPKTDEDKCEETCPEVCEDETCEDTTDNINLESTYADETCEDNKGIYEENPEYHEEFCRLDDVCEEDEEFCRLDDVCEEDEEFYRLDEVCETIPEEECTNEIENVGEVGLDESVQKTLVGINKSVQTSLDTQASKPQESIEKQATTIQESPQPSSTSSPPETTSQPVPEHRVDINTGLDVINSRLDVINQEISTIAHVLSNINNEIKHGSSTVVLDAALELSDRTREIIKGAMSEHLAKEKADKNV